MLLLAFFFFIVAFEFCLIKGCSLQPDADFLTMALLPVLSEVGSVKRQRESRIVNYLQDFIQSLEEGGNIFQYSKLY